MKYESYSEVHRQSSQLTATYEKVLSAKEELHAFFEGSGDILFVASGSSYWASLSAAATMRLMTGRRCCAYKSGEIVLKPDEYKNMHNDPVLVCPSRSGSTTEQTDAARILKSHYPALKILSVVEYENSELEKMSDLFIGIPWACEKSVCQTRSFSCLYLAMITAAGIIAGNDGFLSEIRSYLVMREELEKRDEVRIKDFVDGLDEFGHLVTLGCGRQYGVVIEGAYIGIEVAQIMANYYSLLEYRHGPIVTGRKSTVVSVCSDDAKFALTESVIKDAKQNGSKVIVFAPVRTSDLADLSFTLGKECSDEISALHYIYLMQSFAWHMALRLGNDPDRPGSLKQYIEYEKRI